MFLSTVSTMTVLSTVSTYVILANKKKKKKIFPLTSTSCGSSNDINIKYPPVCQPAVSLLFFSLAWILPTLTSASYVRAAIKHVRGGQQESIGRS